MISAVVFYYIYAIIQIMNEKKKLNLLPQEAKSKYANKYLKLTAAVIAGFFILLLLIQYCQIGVLTLQTNKILADNTGQPIDVIARDTNIDNFMTAQQALEYGLIDKVLYNR